MGICIFLRSMIWLAPCCYNGPPSFTCANLIPPFGWWGWNILFCLKMTKIKLLCHLPLKISHMTHQEFFLWSCKIFNFFTSIFSYKCSWYWLVFEYPKKKKNCQYFLSSRKWNFKSIFWKTQKNHIIWESKIPLALKPQIYQSSRRIIEVNSHWR